MRITTIKLMQRCNLGNYEHIEFSAEAVVEETEGLNEATLKLRDYVDWNVRAQIRNRQVTDAQKVAEDTTQPDEKVEQAKRWLEKHAERKARVEAM